MKTKIILTATRIFALFRYSNNKKITLFIIICSLHLFTYSQVNDSLKKMLNSPSFSLLEDYSGDWGGYTHTFIFTKIDTSIELLWKDPDFPDGELTRELKMILPLSELKNVETLFSGCAKKIHDSKGKSTEHSKYIFKNKDFSYTIDDRFTMECVEDFKTWKQTIFKEGIKQEKHKSKK